MKKSDVEKAWTEIIEKVGSTPSMVFSVIGDSDSFVPIPWAKSVFQTALIEAAKNGGDTWILYRGFNYGVSSIVRRAYQKYGDMEFRANSRKVLVNNAKRHVKLIRIAGKTASSKAQQMSNQTTTESTEAKCSIEPRDKIAFLQGFQEYVSKKEVPFLSQTIDIKLPIPIVVLACEGDIQTIEHIAEALKRKIPVILIKGSGRATDLILDYIENKDLFKKNARVLLGLRFDENINRRVTKDLDEIAQAFDLISVFDVSSDDPLMLSNIIGKAIINCWAMENILRSKNAEARMKSQLEMLKRYREPIAYVSDPKYSSPTSLPLYFYFEYQFLQEQGKLKEHGHQADSEDVKKIREYSSQDEETQKEFSLFAIRLFRKFMGYPELEEIEDIAGLEKMGCEDFYYVKSSDILLWAMFANRREIAEMCWLRTENHLFIGLACAGVLKKMSAKAKNMKNENLLKEFADHAKIFRDRCLAMMDCMYEEDEQNAINLMDEDVSIWGIKTSPLDFAHENFMYDIVAHNCSYISMNNKWYNYLGPDKGTIMKSAFRKPGQFFNAPVTKYTINYFIFFITIVMYSAFVLTSTGKEYYSIGTTKAFEYYVYIWAAGDLLEELIICFGCQEARDRSHKRYYSRLRRHLHDFWNVVDFFSYALMFTALILRHYYSSTDFTAARRIFSLTLLVMYLRFLEFFRVYRIMGPFLIMIKEMLIDLTRFIALAVFVVLGVGMYYHANLWPDHSTIWSGNWVDWRIWEIIYYPYWQLHGETNNKYLEGGIQTSCTNVSSVWKTDPSIDRCPEEDWTVSAIAAIYVLFSNLVLVNLVIAMFSNTFTRVQENAETFWRFNTCTVINDYVWRVPSPINLFLPYRFFCCLKRNRRCRGKCRGCFNKVQELEFANEQRIYRIHLQRNTAFEIFNKM
ncbi:transient receptor potential cation channel subfamily M member 8-like [Saccostrea echinata]|uniref:transient receptor potential cation channel subfamily M member 8-like n=1 Tax=Saccostrea echinata TaxID=191078 RepID=UPI002A84113A|nr:transient receptor potential cation channel subfamily M member 8-like [Saccostrea echinata]